VIITADKTEANIQGSVIQTGKVPKKTFLRVPPAIDAMVAIKAIPP
jgi:hypothetical protein